MLMRFAMAASSRMAVGLTLCIALLLSAESNPLPAQAGKAAKDGDLPPMNQAIVEESIGRGIEFIKTTQNDDGTWGEGGHAVGYTALTGIALIESGVRINDRTISRAAKHAQLDLDALLHHSYATAAAAESLARVQHSALAAEAFIAGLLHNLGILVQVHLDSAGVQAMIEQRQTGDARDVRALEAEYAIVGHEACVAVIFDAWQLPQSLIPTRTRSLLIRA